MPTNIQASLLPDEVRELAQCETIISRGLTSFYEVGAALTAIKIGKLYRAEYPTFPEYCAVRWGIGESQANRVANASASLTKIAETAPVGAVLPQSERQLRPLTPLPPEQKAEAWHSAVQAAGGGQPTNSQVQAAAYALRQPEASAPDQDAPAAASDPQSFEDSVELSPDRFRVLEAGLRAIRQRGLYWAEDVPACIAGCEPEYPDGAADWLHASDCLLSAALNAL